jgi:hypothetical protein
MRFIAALVMLFLVSGTANAEDRENKLFDGQTLAGWEGDEKLFRVEEGAIVGGNLKQAIPHNYFLCTKEQFADFDLKLKFKIIGDATNAGVQFRSQRIPDHHEVRGYQADLGEGYWGCLYDESRRNKVLARPEDEALAKALKKGEWNEYRILCRGPRIQLWINEVQTVDYTERDADIESKGIIGLQIHGGPPGEAWYKDITIERLETSSP